MKTQMNPRMGAAFAPSLLLAAAAMTAAHAQVTLTVDNPGFEDNAAPDAGWVVLPSASFSGWSAYDPSGIINNGANSIGVLMPLGTTHYPSGAPEGRNVAITFLSQGAGEAGLQQTLSSLLAPNTRYTLTIEVGNIASGSAQPPTDTSFFDLDGFPGYRIDLMAGSTVIGSDNNSLAGTIPEGEFRTSTLIVDIGASHAELDEPLAIRLVNLHIIGTPDEPGIEVNFDNVRLTAAAVPEPAATTLAAAAALVAMALFRQLRRRQAN